MTVYYVDPVSGSNGNNGLSWGTAWRVLTSAATILPGDEVRLAKTPFATNTATSVATGSVLTRDAALYSTSVTTSVTWLAAGVAGVTGGANGIAVANNITVPASTRLGYRAVALSNTTHYGISTELLALWAPNGPAGSFLQIALCSDTVGAVPVIFLSGGMSSRTGISTSSGKHPFTFNNGGSLLNFTIASIAIYSIGSFINNSGASASFTSNREFTFTPDQNGPEHIPQGALVQADTTVYDAAPLCVFGTSVDDGKQSCNTLPSIVNLFPMDSTAKARSFYPPSPVRDHERTPLTFSGTAVSPVRLRGGYNTTTDLQDGYTNCDSSTGGLPGLLAAFTFSTGGDYLEFERLLSSKVPLYYRSNTAVTQTINSMKLTDCTTQYLAVHSLVTTLYVVEFTCVRCFLHLWPFWIKLTTAGRTAIRVQAGSTWRFTDCFKARSGSSTIDSVVTTTLMRIEGTAGGRSLLSGGTIYLDNNSRGAFEMDTVTVPVCTISGGGSGVTNLGLLTCSLVNIYMAKASTTATLTIVDFKDVSVNGVTSQSGPASTATLTISFSTSTAGPLWGTGATVPGEGGTVTITGHHTGLGTSSGCYVVSDAHRVTISGTTASGTYYPSLRLTNVRNATVDGGLWSMIDTDYTAGDETYRRMPTTYAREGVTLRNLTANVNSTARAGWVRALDCVLLSAVATTHFPIEHRGKLPGSVSSAYTSIDGMCGFGCTFTTLTTSAVVVMYGAAAAAHSPCRWYGTKYSGTTSINVVLSNGGTSSRRAASPVEMHMELGATLVAAVSTAAYLGGSVFVSGRSGAERLSDGTGGYVVSSTLNAYGRRTIAVRSRTHLGSVHCRTGQSVTISGVIYAPGNSNPTVRLMVPPTDGFSGDINQHMVQYSYPSMGEYTFSFTVSPTSTADLNVFIGIASLDAGGVDVRKIDIVVA
jgi:hypothetical protein